MNCNQQTSLKFLETQKQFLSVMFSCGWGIGTSTGSANDGSNDGRPSGSTALNVVDKGSVKESNTHATIGKGNIEVADGSDTSDINRDISKTETITKDEITGALDATVKIDNRVLGLIAGDTSGVKEIAEDIKNLPTNVQTVVRDISAMPEQIRDVAIDAYKQVIKEDKNFTPENINEFSPDELNQMLKNGTLIQIEEEEEEEEVKFNNDTPIIGVSGKSERKYTVGENGKVYDITDDYIEKNYIVEDVIAIVTGGKIVKYIFDGSKYIDNSIQVPNKALEVLKKAQDTGYRNNLSGLKGGKTWENKFNQLPKGDYKEFDLNKPGTSGRDMERVLVDKVSGKAYYTNNHYETFKPIN